MTVITAQAIENAPTQNFAELLRSVPGVNITQVSARDINVTTRGATGTLSTGQLALLDGRSLYQDFFGFVMWDFLPVNLNEIKQIEVIRGPASAVWGANALNGVVNVITKSPREMQGTSVTFGVGAVRPLGERQRRGRRLALLLQRHARAGDQRSLGVQALGRRLLAGRAAAADRRHPRLARARTVPGLRNTGTTQPKFDARVDYDYEDGRKLSFSGGVAGTDGIMHTGIGPFDINSGSVMGYGKVNFTARRFAPASSPTSSTATRRTCSRATSTASRSSSTSRPRPIDFELSQRRRRSAGGTSSATAATSASTASTCRSRRRPTTAPSSASTSRTRSSCPTSSAGWSAARVDRFDFLDDFVFSPRTTFMVKPSENQHVPASPTTAPTARRR